MKLGACYYPEQWPQARWALDARLMREAGLSLARLADFAWAALEPAEGQYDFAWLDRAIQTLADEGLQVILCTPTASPPAWLSRAYPETLPVNAQGQRLKPGGRRHYCPTSPLYRQHCARVVSAMAGRYGQHPAVAAWQVDNELGWAGTSHCYCEQCAAAFRAWLQARYGSLDALNAAWGTVFWSQTYGDWAEVELPNLLIGGANPGHLLDYQRFTSDNLAGFMQAQIEILRGQVDPRQTVTTNFMADFSELDYYKLAGPLDCVSMSSYPTGQAENRQALAMPQDPLPALAYDAGDPYMTGFYQALMRAYKPGRPFWVLEQQCGSINWSRYNTGIRPGTVRVWTWHALASGAEVVCYFRWRAGLMGQEQMHSGLLRHDGVPGVGLQDLGEMKPELERMDRVGAQPQAPEVALLFDFDSLWALRMQPHHADLTYLRHLFVFYRALLCLGLQADFVAPGAPGLDRYRLVIAPSAYVAGEALAGWLRGYVEGGGTLVIGARSGFKAESNLVTGAPLPGPLRELAGARVSDWQALPPGVGFDLDTSIRGMVGPARVWAESLAVEGAQPLATYASGPYAGAAALTDHTLGAGHALYLGWLPDQRQAGALMDFLAQRCGLQPLAGLPEGVIISRHGPYTLLLNFTDEQQPVDVAGRRVTLAPRGVEVIENPAE